MTRIKSTFIVTLLAAAALASLTGTSRAQAPTAKSSSVLDDAVVQHQTEKGLKYLYNMQFEKARNMFEMVNARHPTHPVGPFLLALNTWWEILLDMSDESRDAEFFAAMEEVIDRSDRLLKKDKKNFDAKFFKGAALGFRGRLRSNRGDWLKAANDGMKAMDYVLDVAKRDPADADYAFGKGIYDYFAAAVPEKYSYVKPVMIFFPKGSKERGIQSLERTAAQGRFIQTEAVYFLLQIHYLFENDFGKSVEYVSWLRKEYPNNSFFQLFEGRVYAKWGHWRKVEEIYADVLERYKDRQRGYNAAAAEQALYFLSRSHMAHGRYPTALEYVKQLDALTARNSRKSYFEVLGRLREGMIYDAMGERQRAVTAYREVLKMGDWSGAHDRAKRYLDEPYSG